MQFFLYVEIYRVKIGEIYIDTKIMFQGIYDKRTHSKRVANLHIVTSSVKKQKACQTSIRASPGSISSALLMINSCIIIFFHPASLFVYQNMASVFPPAKACLAAQIKAVPGSFQLRLEWIRKRETNCLTYKRGDQTMVSYLYRVESKCTSKCTILLILKCFQDPSCHNGVSSQWSQRKWIFRYFQWSW